LLLVGIAYGLAAGILEETGWTGFAIPRLRLRHGILATGLIVGVLWGVWHFLSNFALSGDASGAFLLLSFLAAQVFALGVLPAYRVLIVWVHDHTRSLLVAMLMHFSLTASWMILVPAATAVQLMAFYLVLTVGLWAVVGAVALGRSRRLSRQPLRPQAA
jgi:membrane protease YdiL (CAAX protease family)